MCKHTPSRSQDSLMLPGLSFLFEAERTSRIGTAVPYPAVDATFCCFAQTVVQDFGMYSSDVRLPGL